MTILEKIKSGFTLFDGGTGTVLQKKGLLPGELPEEWNLTHGQICNLVNRRSLSALHIYRIGICAVETSERAALQKDNKSQARTIKSSHTLVRVNIEQFRHTIPILYIKRGNMLFRLRILPAALLSLIRRYIAYILSWNERLITSN